MALNVGINGFGRIGRIIFRTCLQKSLKVTAINDPAVDIEYICYLIKFDSTHGKFHGTLERSDSEITVDGHKILIFREKLPTCIPWHRADVQYVVEASGMFINLEKSSGHLASDGVKRVLVTAPGVDLPTLVLGVNEDQLNPGHKVISCASSTLYCLAPIIKILEDRFGISEGFITSIHAMTPSLKPLDGLCLKGKHWRDHRSIHQNIIPATTGACRALGRIIPQVKDKMMGLAFRVPIVNVSVLDISIRLNSNTTIECIRKQVEDYGNKCMKNVIRVSDEQAVSSDFIGDTHSCILDLDSSMQMTPNYFKLICWYENEYSYACRVIDSIQFLERQYELEWKSKMAYMRSTPKKSLSQQRECHNKFTYHQACSYDCHGDPKSLCSTSQDSGFVSPKGPAKKPVFPRYLGTRRTQYEIPKRKNELFKIWNDKDETIRAPGRHNRTSFFHSCVTLAPDLKVNRYVNTQERLENVKREFSKMVSMTDNLLKQSQSSKINKGLSLEQSKDETGDTNIKKPMYNEINFSSGKTSISFEYNDTHNVKDQEKKSDGDKKSNEHSCNNEFINNIQDKIYYYGSPANKNGIIPPTTSNYSKDTFNTKGTLENDYTIHSDTPNTPGVQNKSAEKLMVTNTTDKMQTTTDFKEETDDHVNALDLVCTDSEYYQRTNTSMDNKTNKIISECPKQEDVCLSTDSPKLNADIKIISDGVDTVKREVDSQDKQRNLQKRLDGILKKLAYDSSVISKTPSTFLSAIRSINTVTNKDIFDKLDSVSASDSENSFHMNERKSQVINITDLTKSLEDLEKLDKICRIIEISDELSDQLLSALNYNECKELKNKKWSFKDFCEKVKLEDFCNKMFSKSI